jgi:hypothetical protein
MVNVLSLVALIIGLIGFGDIYFGASRVWGVGSVLVLILAVGNIVVCRIYLKKRRLMIQTREVKYSRVGAVFGILGAVATIIAEGIFTPAIDQGWDWIGGNLVTILFVMPIFLFAAGIVTLVLVVVQLGFYLTSIVSYIMLYNKVNQANQTTSQTTSQTASQTTSQTYNCTSPSDERDD